MVLRSHIPQSVASGFIAVVKTSNVARQLVQNQAVITLDIDWAPDWVIDEAAAILMAEHVKATWFITHQSPAIERLSQRADLFELGMHPNFLPGSTHGDTEDEVFQHMRKLLPGATSMRTHALHQSSPLLIKAAKDYGVTVDVSMLLPYAEHLKVHTRNLHGALLRRVPFFWEDDVEMAEHTPCWDMDAPLLNGPGLHVFNFHPIHVALNTTSPGVWESCKRQCPLHSWTTQFLQKHRYDGPGPRTLFQQLARRLHGSGRTVSEIALAEEVQYGTIMP